MNNSKPTVEEKKFLLKFFEYVQLQFSNFGNRPRLFIEKTFGDSKYDKKSRKGKIGVLAGGDLEAKILLIYLKIIMNNNWTLLFGLKKKRYDYDRGYEPYYDKLIKLINSSYFLSVKWYLEEEPIEIVHEYYGYPITIDYYKVDMWDLERIKETIDELETRD